MNMQSFVNIYVLQMIYYEVYNIYIYNTDALNKIYIDGQ